MLEVMPQASSFHGAWWNQCPADTRRLTAELETSTVCFSFCCQDLRVQLPGETACL